MSRIVILADEPLLSACLADIFTRELGAETTVISEEKSLLIQPELLVATKAPSAEWTGKTLIITPGAPQKIAQILSLAAEKLAEKSTIVTLGSGIRLLEKRRLLEADGKAPVELTEKEQALLLFIYQAKQASRDDILKEVWGVADGVHTQTFETHLYRLRQKWREIADFDCIVASDKGYGWHE